MVLVALGVIALRASDGIDWGSAPEWVMAVVTLVAAIVALMTYRRSVQVRREAQPRLVYSKVLETKHHGTGAVFDRLPEGATRRTVAPNCADLQRRSGHLVHVAVVPVTAVTVAVHNGSDELIGPARVQTVHTETEEPVTDVTMGTSRVEPGADWVAQVVFPNEVHPAQPPIGTSVVFRDATGQWWRRRQSHPIEPARHPDAPGPPTPTFHHGGGGPG